MQPEYTHTAVGVLAVIVNDDHNKVLLVLSKDRGWEPPMGFLEPGEAPLTALHREVLEETGYTVHITGLAGIYHCIKEGMPIITMSFLCKAGERVTDRIEESLEVKWVNRERLEEFISRPSHMLRVASALNNRSTVMCDYQLNPFSVTNFLIL